MQHSKYQTGLSLIEIQVALVIGLILIAGAAQLFINNQQTFRTESALARMQQTGRFIVETIANDIRMAGYTGCVSREGNAPIIVNTATALPYPLVNADGNLTNIIAGNDGQGGNHVPALPATLINPNAAARAINTRDTNADIITIQRASQCGAAVTAASSGTSPISVNDSSGCNFRSNQGAAIITNCGRSDLFDIGNVTFDANGNVQTITPNTALSQSYTDNAFIYQFISNTYYIAPSQIDANNNNPEPALWVDRWDPQVNRFTSTELADGVEDLQILYGEDTGGADTYPDLYRTIDTVTNIDNVRSVRINLLLRSADRITTQNQTVFFNGNNFTPPDPTDRRLRTVYTSTISIRNQLP